MCLGQLLPVQLVEGDGEGEQGLLLFLVLAGPQVPSHHLELAEVRGPRVPREESIDLFIYLSINLYN